MRRFFVSPHKLTTSISNLHVLQKCYEASLHLHVKKCHKKIHYNLCMYDFLSDHGASAKLTMCPWVRNSHIIHRGAWDQNGLKDSSCKKKNQIIQKK